MTAPAIISPGPFRAALTVTRLPDKAGPLAARGVIA
jgi:hypothetical protein